MLLLLAALVPAAMADGYKIQVVDTHGTPLSNAWAIFEDSAGLKGAVADRFGFVSLDRAVVGPLHIKVQCPGHADWTNDDPDWVMTDLPYEIIELHTVEQPELGLESAICKRDGGSPTDVTKKVMQINCRASAAAVIDLVARNFTLDCSTKKQTDSACYAIYQNGKLIAESKDGHFDLHAEQFDSGEGVYVKVTDAIGRSATTNLMLKFYTVSFNSNIFSMNLGKISFSAPDDAPFVGGSRIDIEVPLKCPFNIALAENKIMVGWGVTDETSKEEQLKKINGAKELLNEVASTTATFVNNSGLTAAQKDKFNQLVSNSSGAKFMKPAFIQMVGYGEMTFDEIDPYKFKTISGNILFQVSRQLVDGNWTTWCGIIPVNISMKVSVGLDALITISYDFKDEIINGDFQFTPSLSLNAFGGVGIGKVAAVGVYGNATLSGTLASVPEFHLQNVDLTGEMGLKAYVWVFTYTKTFAKNTWHLYTHPDFQSRGMDGPEDAASYFNALLGMTDFAQYQQASLAYLANEGEWISEREDPTSSGDDAVTAFTKLLGGTYRNAQPVMVSANGKLYAAFVRADDTDGRRYTVASKYENGKWSPLKETQTDAFMDSEPKLAVSGDSIYLSYLRMPAEMGQQAFTARNQEELLLSFAQNQQLVVGRLNPDTLEFTEEKVFECEGFLHSYQLSANEDSVTVAWFESELTTGSSVLAHTSSDLYTATLTGNEWSDATEIASINGNVGNIIIGERDGETLVAYTVNHPLNDIGEYTASLYVIGNDGTAECITDDCSGKVSFARLPSTEQSDFVWNDEDMLVNAAGEKIAVANINGSYVIVGNSIYYSAAQDSCGNLTAVQYIDGAWTSAMEIIADDAYLEDLSIVTVDGETYVLGMNTTVTITDDDLDDAKDMVFAQLSSVSDLVLADILCDRANLVAGEDTTVNLYIINAGDHAVNSVDIWMDGNFLETRQVTIPFNTTKTIPVTLKCPSEERTYTFEVREPNENQHCAGKNTATVTLGYADFDVILTKHGFGAAQRLLVSVVNKGIAPAVGKLQLFATDGEETTVVYETDLNLLSGKSFNHVEIAEQIPHSGESVTFTAVVTPEVVDHNIYNNRDVVVITYNTMYYLGYEKNMMILPTSAVTIEAEAFANCGFEAVETGAELERIGERAFANSEALKQVRLGSKITFIADDAFEGCPNVILWCPYGSYAAEYAHAHGISYKLY